MSKELTDEKCRDQFEEWMTSLPGFEVADVERRDDGKYSYSETEWCWKSWQASRQALEIALPVLEQQEGKRQVTLREAVSEIRQLTEESGGYNFEALREEQEGRSGECLWSYDYGDNFWSAACGEAWCFTDGGPEENRVKFCQGCGLPVALEQQDRDRGREE